METFVNAYDIGEEGIIDVNHNMFSYTYGVMRVQCFLLWIMEIKGKMCGMVNHQVPLNFLMK